MRRPHLVILALTMAAAWLAGPALAQADEVGLLAECRLTDERLVAIDLSLTGVAPRQRDVVPDLIVKGVFIEVRSATGGFWVQLKQDKTANLEFELCSVLREAGISTDHLDSVRVMVEGQVSGGGQTVGIGGRCGNFPPPDCSLGE